MRKTKRVQISLTNEIDSMLSNQAYYYKKTKSEMAKLMVETMVKFYSGDQSGFRIIVDEGNKLRLRGIANYTQQVPPK